MTPAAPMKVKLTHNKGVWQLAIGGEIDKENFVILKAGISKLLRTGKNKIILDLMAATGISNASVQELGALNTLAAELEGQIVICTANTTLIQDIQKATRPQRMICAPTMELAMSAFSAEAPAPASLRAPASQPAAPAPQAAAPAASQPAPQAVKPAQAAPEKAGPAPAQATSQGSSPNNDPLNNAMKQIGELKEKIRELQSGELDQQRREAAQFRAQNVELQKELAALVLARRAPATEAAYQDKIKTLEKQLDEALVKISEIKEK